MVSRMKTYPLFVLLKGRPALVVGGGTVGERKARELLRAGAKVTVVSRDLTPGLAALAQEGRVAFIPGEFSPEQLEGMTLVIGATDNPEVNRQISLAAQARGLWVNIVDAPELCTFIVPAKVCRGPLTIAISTGGAAPALARRLREDLERQFGPEYQPYLELLQEIRQRVLKIRRGHPDNPRLFENLLESPLKEAVARKDRRHIAAILREHLGTVLPQEEIDETLAVVSQEILAGEPPGPAGEGPPSCSPRASPGQTAGSPPHNPDPGELQK